MVLRTSGLLLLVRSATAERARVGGVVAVAAGVVVGAAVEVVEAVEVVAAVGVEAVAVVGVGAVGLELVVEVLEEARGSSSSVGGRPRRPSSFVTVLVRHAGSLTLSTAASPASMKLGVLSLVTRPSAPAEQTCFELGLCMLCLLVLRVTVTAPPSLLSLHLYRSGILVSGLPRSLTPLLPSPAPPCLPCVEGWQRAAPHSSFPSRIAPLHTLHMDVWGPARVTRQCRERYFLLVVDDYTRYTMVFPLRSKGERRIGLVMEVARTSMVHAAAPHFLWPFAVRYAAHQLNLWPRVSLPETLPTLGWMGKVDDASVFRFWGSRASVRDTSADKLSARAIPCVFLGFVLDALGWQFNHPTLRRVLPSQDVTFDESVPFYRLCPYRSAPLPPPPHFLAPGPPPVDPLPPQGPTPSGVSQVDPPPGTVPGEFAVDSGAVRGAASGGAEPGGAETVGAEPRGAETGGAEPGGAETRGAEPEGAESGGAELRGARPRQIASFNGNNASTGKL
ncbi:unnamed protein product [Closterium sp. NIES-53]